MSNKEKIIRIGAKPFNEQRILANLIGEFLGEKFEIVVSEPIPEGNFLNLKDGKIHLCVDYLGSLYNTSLKLEPLEIWNKELMLQKLVEKLNSLQINFVSFLGFSNDFVFLSKTFLAKNLEDLSKISKDLILSCPPPFIERKDGISLIKNRYKIEFKEIVPLNVDKMYDYLMDNRVNLITGFKTDSKIEKFNLYIIEDNLKAFPPYDALILSKNLDKEKIEKLKNFKINENEIRHLNYLMDFENKTLER